jgi:hypothetical protein
MNKSNKIIIGVAIVYVAWGIWIICKYKGTPTDERWEWQIGTSKRINHYHEEP